MSPKIFKLTLVRHGQTTHNKSKTIQGQMNTQLTDLGRDQAKLLNKFLENSKSNFERVYSSDLTRAYETCQLVCNGRYEIITDRLLRERSFGVLEGSPLDLLRSASYRAGFNESNFTQFRPEGGESMEEVQERISKFCHQVLFPQANPSSNILIVTHGGVIREFMKFFRLSGCPLANSDLIISPNTGISEFEIHLDQNNGIKQIKTISLHQIPHLASKAKDEALNEEQLNDASTKKEEEHAV